jgi:hypothetical protein
LAIRSFDHSFVEAISFFAGVGEAHEIYSADEKSPTLIGYVGLEIEIHLHRLSYDMYPGTSLRKFAKGYSVAPAWQCP